MHVVVLLATVFLGAVLHDHGFSGECLTPVSRALSPHRVSSVAEATLSVHRVRSRSLDNPAEDATKIAFMQHCSTVDSRAAPFHTPSTTSRRGVHAEGGCVRLQNKGGALRRLLWSVSRKAREDSNVFAESLTGALIGQGEFTPLGIAEVGVPFYGTKQTFV
jgi:hypothetical protein